MTDRYQTPLEITQLITKGASGGLTASEQRKLVGYAISARGQDTPEVIDFIHQLVAESPVDETAASPFPSALTPSSLPSVADQVAASQASNTPNMRQPTLDWAAPLGQVKTAVADEVMDPFGGNPDLRSPSPSFASPFSPFGDVEGPGAAPAEKLFSPFAETPYRERDDTDDTLPVSPIGQTPPRQGGKRTEDWKGQRASMMGENLGAPESSAFYGLAPDVLEAMMANPAMAARQIANHLAPDGQGTAAMAAIIEPQFRAALDLAVAGTIAGDRELGAPRGAGDRLALAEAFMQQARQPGTQVNPQALYMRALRSAGRTDPNAMLGQGEGAAGDVGNQVALTNSAMMTAAGSGMYLTPDSQARLAARLQDAGDEYTLAVANGTIDPNVVSYPRWLKEEKKAKRWVSAPLTREQIAAAF